MKMNHNLYQQLDLNLLRTFLILYEELNMRRAAERLFISQPAVSQALKKLRYHFNDELFVKVSAGLEATAFADELKADIYPHLSGLESVINKNIELDLQSLNQTLEIALSPVVMACLSGSLYKAITKQAPNAKLVLTAWSSSTLEDIRKGKTLLGVNYDLKHPKELYSKRLVQLEGRAIVRQGHPLAAQTVTLAELAKYDIASMIIPGWNDNFVWLQKVMEEKGLTSRVGFRSEIMMALIDVVLHTNMFLPHSNLFPQEFYPNLRVLKIEQSHLIYNESIQSLYHIKNRNNPVQLWLSQLIKKVLEEQLLANKD
ncbi:LysR family transcriptional regulator [Agarivorans sp. OAG1]|nr:LysR family transcriptional regulator [Agarivorans sp. OAG1]